MVKIPLRSNGALNTALLKKQEKEVRSACDLVLAHLPLPQIAWHLEHNIAEVPLCFCGKPRYFKGFGKGYSAACNKSCSGKQKSAEATMLLNYGVKNPFQLEKTKKQIKNTVVERYGVEYACQTISVKEKSKATNLLKYNVEYPTQSTIVIEKRHRNNIEKYGVKEPMMLPEFSNKIKETNNKKYGENAFTKTLLGRQRVKATRKITEDIKNPNRLKLRDIEAVLIRYNELKSLTLLSKDLGIKLNYLSRWFRQNGLAVDQRYITSSTEQEVFDFLVENGFNPSLHNRTCIKPYELDIIVENLAIEINGIYWHSFNVQETTEEKIKHVKKLEKATAAGFSFLQFTDIEWSAKKDIIKSIILHRLKKSMRLGARETVITAVSSKDSVDFLNQNHFQGSCNASVRLGLSYKEQLVMVATFAKHRFSKHAKWELIRLASLKGVSIIGGAEKLIKHFTQHHIGNIISYSNRALFNGEMYEKLGFTLVKVNGPRYSYFFKGKMFSRIKLQKHKLTSVLKHFDPQLSEAENYFKNGFRRYWDCGTCTWLLKDIRQPWHRSAAS